MMRKKQKIRVICLFREIRVFITYPFNLLAYLKRLLSSFKEMSESW